MTSPAANTVTIMQVDGTSLWSWTRYYGFTQAVTDDRGVATDETVEIIQPISSQFTFPDSDSALANAKVISADLDDGAFTVAS